MAATDHDGHRGPGEFDWMTEIDAQFVQAFEYPGVLEDDKTGDLRRLWCVGLGLRRNERGTEQG
jgi:hypothetical protein